jgi:hypothetical protein
MIQKVQSACGRPVFIERVVRLTCHSSAETTNKLEKVKDEIFLAKSNEDHLKKVSKEMGEKEEAKKDAKQEPRRGRKCL